MDRLENNIAAAARTAEKIIEESRRQRDEKGFSPKISATQTSSLRTMEQAAWVDAHWPIAWPRWPRGLSAKAVALMHKVTRRALRWYINPIVNQQNAFNEAAWRATQSLADEVAALRVEQYQASHEQQARFAELQGRVEVLEQMLKTREL